MRFREVSTFIGTSKVRNIADWVGFLRSDKPVDGQRRYMAKCKACDQSVLGTKSTLSQHRSKCPKRDAVAATLPPPTAVAPRTIDSVFPRHKTAQEDLDDLLGKAIIVSNVVFR